MLHCHGALSWRIVMAHCHGALSWRIVMAHCHGALSWRIVMAHCHGAAEYYRHSTHNNKCCIVMAQLNTIDIVLTITNAA